MKRPHCCSAVMVVLALSGCAVQQGDEHSSAQVNRFDPAYCDALVSTPAQIAVDRFIDQSEESTDHGQELFDDLRELGLIHGGYDPGRIDVVRWGSRPIDELTVTVMGAAESIRFNVRYATQTSGLGDSRGDLPRSVEAQVDRGVGFMDCRLAADGGDGLDGLIERSQQATERVNSFCNTLLERSRQARGACTADGDAPRDDTGALDCPKRIGEADGLKRAADLCQTLRSNIDRTL